MDIDTFVTLHLALTPTLFARVELKNKNYAGAGTFSGRR
jgi:hypothetical protein